VPPFAIGALINGAGEYSDCLCCWIAVNPNREKCVACGTLGRKPAFAFAVCPTVLPLWLVVGVHVTISVVRCYRFCW
jgi:hypothetical protein